MSRHVLGMGLLAVTANAQANYAGSGFQYVGCVEADPQVFGLNIDFSQPFTPQECQAACAGKSSFAALGGGCRCDVPQEEIEITFKILDEAACSVLCIPDNPDAGRCGGSGDGAADGTQLFNLYRTGGEAVKMDDCDDEHADTLNKAVEALIVTETIISCPPEKTDCPLKAANRLPVVPPTTTPEPCGPEGCPPVFNKVPAVCPEEGCRSCPPEGCPPCSEGSICLPPCPEGCVAPPPPSPAPTPIQTPTTLVAAVVTTTEAPIAPPPPPSEPTSDSNASPEEPAVNAGRQERGATVEMLTIVCAAIVLLAF